MSYYELLNIRYKINIKVIIVLVIFISLVIWLMNKSVSSVYNTYAYYKDNYLIVNIPIDNPDTINNMEYIKINDNLVKGKVIKVSEEILDSAANIAYQEIYMDIDYSLYDNQVLKVTIYYNNEKVGKKIKRLLI